MRIICGIVVFFGWLWLVSNVAIILGIAKAGVELGDLGQVMLMLSGAIIAVVVSKYVCGSGGGFSIYGTGNDDGPFDKR